MDGSLKKWLLKAYHSWATRSLAVGAIATVLDIAVGLLCVKALVWSTRTGAMLGVAFGATFTFFANRYFAFREHDPRLAKPALKFVVATLASMLVHGQLVVVMRDWFGVPFVPAKMVADIAVFTVGQLLLLRFVVFPKAKAPAREPMLPVTVASEGEPEPDGVMPSPEPVPLVEHRASRA